MNTTNLWTDQTPRPADIPTSELPETADLLIVGSGYTGLHTARAVSNAGGSAVVVEQETIGWGASSRNGGMLTPGLKSSIKIITKRYGQEKARYFWQWALDAIDHVDRVIREDQIDCGWQRNGHIALAVKPEHFERYKSYKQFLNDKLGYEDPVLVAPSDLGSEIGSKAFFGGLSDEHSGGLDPARYVFGLARAVGQKPGVTLVENANVTRIQRANGAFQVTTSKGMITAKDVLLATNGYTTNQLSRKARSGIFPVGSYIIATEPLSPELQKELSPKGRMFYDSKYFLNYFRVSPDGRMIFGGRNNLSTDLDLHKSAILLQTRMVEVYPQLKDVPLTHTWTGKLGLTYDLMPHIGRVNGVWYAYGYGGHGASIASYMGLEVGQLLSGQKQSSPFMEIYHPRFFFTQFDKLFLPFVAQYYRIVDRLS